MAIKVIFHLCRIMQYGVRAHVNLIKGKTWFYLIQLTHFISELCITYFANESIV